VFSCNDAPYIHKIVPGVRVVPQEGYQAFLRALVYAGGTQFYSFPLTRYDNSFGAAVNKYLSYISQPGRLVKRSYEKMRDLFCTLNGLHIAAIGVGLGPFVEGSKELDAAKNLFKNMKFIAVRDLSSKAVCDSWGCANVLLRSDLCYLPDFVKAVTINCALPNKPYIARIAVIVRDWPHAMEGRKYMAALEAVVDELRRRGKTVDYVSFASRYDREWIARADEKHENVIGWDPENQTLEGFLKVLSGYDIFITTRYHGAVFASILHKPTLCVEIEQKLALVADLLKDGARRALSSDSSKEPRRIGK
jgi:polysaccharide pyruvyl transferase WcaK-like protein